ncbi:MAG: polyphosphate glucokinase [Chloroflexi bacterium RBG_13_48_10]|nr:MAG: polyphosphate glucokinase [Chloroflexi bacterium RBG_13_48_10]
MQILGIDIGGTGIKGALVETDTGSLLAERYRMPTPEGAKPAPIAEVVKRIALQFDWHAPIGCGFPAVIRNGVAESAANINQKWIGTNVAQLFSEATGCPVYVVNDADAAGLAEVNFGAGRGVHGVVMMITIGTGLGSALFIDGKLVPNTELGHIEIECDDAESLASDNVRKQQDLSWKKWAKRLDKYLRTLESLFSPDLMILGGGAVKNQDQFFPLLTLHTKVVPAQLGNDAGIVGAALAAQQNLKIIS